MLLVLTAVLVGLVHMGLLFLVSRCTPHSKLLFRVYIQFICNEIEKFINSATVAASTVDPFVRIYLSTRPKGREYAGRYEVDLDKRSRTPPVNTHTFGVYMYLAFLRANKS